MLKSLQERLVAPEINQPENRKRCRKANNTTKHWHLLTAISTFPSPSTVAYTSLPPFVLHLAIASQTAEPTVRTNIHPSYCFLRLTAIAHCLFVPNPEGQEPSTCECIPIIHPKPFIYCSDQETHTPWLQNFLSFCHSIE